MVASTRRARLDDLDANTLLVMRDKLQDRVGDLGHWLSGYDFMPGFYPPQEAHAQMGRNIGYWWVSAGGLDRRFAALRSRDASLQRALATIAPARWVLRSGQVLGWEPVPVFPYRLIYGLLEEFGIRTPDKYIKTGAHQLARSDRAVFGLMACGPTTAPFYTTSLHDTVVEMRGRGYRCSASAYQFVTAIVGWSNRLELRERLYDADFRALSKRVGHDANAF